MNRRAILAEAVELVRERLAPNESPGGVKRGRCEICEESGAAEYEPSETIEVRGRWISVGLRLCEGCLDEIQGVLADGEELGVFAKLYHENESY